MENKMLTLEEHRAQTLGELLKLLTTKNKVICPRYPGYGKTSYIAGKLFKIYNDKSFLVLAPTNTIKQSYLDLKLDNVMVSTYQGLLYKSDIELLKLYSNVNFIVCDECHHLDNNTWTNRIDVLFNNLNNIKIIGLTGTSVRGDGQDVINNYFEGNTTSEFGIFDAIQAGYLPKIKYVRAFYEFTDDMLKKYNQEMIPDNVINIKEILSKYIKNDRLLSNFKILVYIPRLNLIEHTSNLCLDWFGSLYPDKKINIYYQTSEENESFNLDMLNKFKYNNFQNDIDIMISVDKIKEGVHIDNVNTEILLRKTKSPCLYIQQLGRCLNKGLQPLVFDLIDNYSSVEYIEPTCRHEYKKTICGDKRVYKTFEDILDCIELKDEVKSILDVLSNFKRRNKVTPDNIDFICKSYDNGMKIEDIMNITNHSKSTVYSIINEYYKGPKRIKIPDSKKILSLYKDGWSIERLAKEFHHHTLTIKNIIPEELLRINYRVNEEVRQIAVNRVCRLYDEGKSQRSIIKETNLSGRLIRDILVKHRGYKIKQFKPLTEEDELEICRLYNEGYSINKISSKVKKDSKAITRILEKHNVQKRKPILPNDIRVKISKKKQNQICELYKNNKSVKDIADMFKLNIKSIYKVLKLNGVERNGNRRYGKYIPPYTQEQIDNIISIYKRTGAKTLTAKEVGMNVKTVKRILDYMEIS